MGNTTPWFGSSEQNRIKLINFEILIMENRRKKNITTQSVKRHNSRENNAHTTPQYIQDVYDLTHKIDYFRWVTFINETKFFEQIRQIPL